jgi:hypothetical protein
MKNPTYLFIVIAVLLFTKIGNAQIYVGKTCELSFFSDAEVEKIAAVNKTTKPILNTATNDFLFKVTIIGFRFESALMEEHFNENYMESSKYPYATFKGKVNEKIDYKKDGTYKVTATGKLNVHGVEQERTIDGTLTIKGNEITLQSTFNIALKDHRIEIPKLVFKNIAEVVEVKLNALLIPN